MGSTQPINFERIAWCCAEYGITATELASKTHLKEATLHPLRSGHGSLSFAQLSTIADFFDRSVLFFLEPGPVDKEKVHTPVFRTLTSQKSNLTPNIKALIELVEKQREIYLSLREDMPEAGFPKFQPPDLPLHNLAEAAQVARQWLHIGETNSFDSYRMALESRGILVFQSNGDSEKSQIAKGSPIVAFSIYHAECPVIVINKQEAESQPSFTLMHALGHLLLHKTSAMEDESDLQSHQGQEHEANVFAKLLLAPDRFLQHINDAERPQRPSPIFGDLFVRTVLDALSARHITLAKASTYLDGLKISDLHRLEQYYAGA